MNDLQKALTGNAVFSTFSGLLLLIKNDWIYSVFGLTTGLPFLIIGGGLLFFATTIIVEIKKQRYKPVYWIIIQDLLWVLGSIILLLIRPFGLSTMGNILIAAVAFVVFIFAVLQYWGLKKNLVISA